MRFVTMLPSTTTHMRQVLKMSWVCELGGFKSRPKGRRKGRMNKSKSFHYTHYKMYYIMIYKINLHLYTYIHGGSPIRGLLGIPGEHSPHCPSVLGTYTLLPRSKF